MPAKKNKAISDEQIIAAIMDSGTFTEAAAKLDISVRTIQDRMSERDFRKLYATARQDLLRRATANLTNRLTEAINAVAEIMTDREVNAAVRLQAAQTIITNADKFTQRLSIDETADDIEFSKIGFMGI